MLLVILIMNYILGAWEIYDVNIPQNVIFVSVYYYIEKMRF